MRPTRRALALALAPALALLLPTVVAQEQVHLGVRDPDALAGYTVSWVITGLDGPTSVTFRGPEGDVSIEGERRDGPTPGLVYEARLPPLAPGTNASYLVGDREFPLRVPANGTPLRVVFLGDMGTTREAGAAVEAIAGLEPHLVLHVGDVSYAGGDPLTWKAWFDLVEPVASQVPWLPALGNHEGDVQGLSLDQASAPDPVEQAVFLQRFPQPADTFWWSADIAGVHLIALDTFSGLTMPPAEAEWLAADLASPAAQEADWVIAFLHEPPYSSNANHGSSPRAYDAFAAVLEEAGVDLVVTGHDHFYERTHLLRGGEVVSTENDTPKGEGTRYVVTGGGGAELYTGLLDPQPAWSATREPLHHVLALEITPDRLAARVVATTDSDYTDAFSIAASRDAPPTPPQPTPAIGIAWIGMIGVAIAFALTRRR